jgi:signal transduction histidine kinase
MDRARREAEAANQAKDRFLATLSHELRTPLTPVLAVITGLQDEKRLHPEVRGQIAMMRRNVELEARLIDDLLDLTRISRGKLELRREVSDLRQIVDHSLQTAMNDLIGKRLNLVMDLAHQDHRAWVDIPRLTQVFWNLFRDVRLRDGRGRAEEPPSRLRETPHEADRGASARSGDPGGRRPGSLRRAQRQ